MCIIMAKSTKNNQIAINVIISLPINVMHFLGWVFTSSKLTNHHFIFYLISLGLG